MGMRTGNWAEFIAPGLIEYAVNEYQMYSPKYPRMTMVMDMDGAYDESVNATGIKDLVAENEGSSTSEQEMLEGYKTRYTPVKYRTKVKITRELYDDGRYGDMKSFVREQISISSRISEEKIATSLFRSGFSAYTSYGDAIRLYSTLHPRKDGGSTQSNASSTGITLTEANLETQFLLLEKVLSDTGQIIEVVGDSLVKLLVPHDLEKEAKIITGSTLRSATANNDTNVYLGSYEVIPSRYLGAEVAANGLGETVGSATAWYLQSPIYNKLTVKFRDRFEATDWFDEDTEILWIKARVRMAKGWNDWRGNVGSKGDGAAYSS